MIDATALISPDPTRVPLEIGGKPTGKAEPTFRDQLFENFAPAERPTPPPRSDAQDSRDRSSDTAQTKPDRDRAAAETREPADTPRSTETNDDRSESVQGTTGSDDKAADATNGQSDQLAEVTDDSDAEDGDVESEGEGQTQAAITAVKAETVTAANSKTDEQASGRATIDNALPGLPRTTENTSTTTATVGNTSGKIDTSTLSDASGDPTQGEGEAKPQTGRAESTAARSGNAQATTAFTPTAPLATADANNNPVQPTINANGPTPQTAPTPTPLGDGPDALNEARLARGLKSALNQQGGSVTLRLTPPEMGTVRIQMQIQGTQVAAQFHAETDAARSLLQQQLGQLRTALEGQGLSVDRLGVQSMSAGNASGFNGSNLQQQNQSFGQNQSDGQANPNHDGRSRGFFQQSNDSQQRESTNLAAPEDFAELVEADAVHNA
ncbi:MAG: flagellar hook-length control protein FliK [Planctomycetota bacterium]